MTNNAKYTAELNGIKASEAFKQNTKALLAKAQAGVQLPPASAPTPKLRHFTARRIAAFAAAILILVSAIGILRFATNAGTEMEAAGAASLAASAPEADMAAPYMLQESPDSAISPQAPPSSGYFAKATSGAGANGRGLPPSLPLQTDIPPANNGSLWLYSFDDYSRDWPLTPEATPPESLPVYQNPALLNLYSYSELRLLAEELALSLDDTIQTFEGEPAPTDDTPTEVKAYCVNHLITVYPSGQVEIEVLNHDAPLHYTVPEATAPYESHYAFMQTMLDWYAPLLGGMQTPTPRLTFTYNAKNQPVWGYSVYDAGSNLAEQLQNRSLAGATFHFNQKLQLTSITLTRIEPASFVGEYPLISLQQATSQLASGNGYHFNGATFPGEGYIVKTDLVYLQNSTNLYTMPFYKFYVQISSTASQTDALTQFEAWYVPAIQPQFLTTE